MVPTSLLTAITETSSTPIGYALLQYIEVQKSFIGIDGNGLNGDSMILGKRSGGPREHTYVLDCGDQYAITTVRSAPAKTQQREVVRFRGPRREYHFIGVGANQGRY